MIKGRNSTFQFFQPNEKDKKNKYGDCTIRALCKVLRKSWGEVFSIIAPVMRAEQNLISGFTLDQYKRLYKSLGFEYHGIRVQKGQHRPTVSSFAHDHPRGSFVCHVAHHHVAIVDGKYYDTWDSGSRSLYGYFEKTRH